MSQPGSARVSTELDETLTRRKRKSEASGAVFESSGAEPAPDTVRGENIHGHSALDVSTTSRGLGRLTAAGLLGETPRKVEEATEEANPPHSQKQRELDETLSRRRQRAEAEGSVFEAAGRSSGADMTWDVHTSSQFTPRQMSARSKKRGSGALAGKERRRQKGHQSEQAPRVSLNGDELQAYIANVVNAGKGGGDESNGASAEVAAPPAALTTPAAPAAAPAADASEGGADKNDGGDEQETEAASILDENADLKKPVPAENQILNKETTQEEDQREEENENLQLTKAAKDSEKSQPTSGSGSPAAIINTPSLNGPEDAEDREETSDVLQNARGASEAEAEKQEEKLEEEATSPEPAENQEEKLEEEVESPEPADNQKEKLEEEVASPELAEKQEEKLEDASPELPSPSPQGNNNNNNDNNNNNNNNNTPPSSPSSPSPARAMAFSPPEKGAHEATGESEREPKAEEGEAVVATAAMKPAAIPTVPPLILPASGTGFEVATPLDKPDTESGQDLDHAAAAATAKSADEAAPAAGLSDEAPPTAPASPRDGVAVDFGASFQNVVDGLPALASLHESLSSVGVRGAPGGVEGEGEGEGGGVAFASGGGGSGSGGVVGGDGAAGEGGGGVKAPASRDCADPEGGGEEEEDDEVRWQRQAHQRMREAAAAAVASQGPYRGGKGDSLAHSMPARASASDYPRPAVQDMMSSTSYFQHLTRTPASLTEASAAAPDTQTGKGSAYPISSPHRAPTYHPREGPAFQPPTSAPGVDPLGPFPRAKSVVLQQKLQDVQPDVADLRRTVEAALSSKSLHLADVEAILGRASELQAKTRLSEADLKTLGWPSEALHQMQEAAHALKYWRQSEEAAKEVVEGRFSSATGAQSSAASLQIALEALEALLSSCIGLTAISKVSPLPLDFNLDRRTKTAPSVLSALLDQALVHLRDEPDIAIAGRLETMLKQGRKRREIQELKLDDVLAQASLELTDLLESHIRSTGTFASRSGSNIAPHHRRPPDEIWTAVVEGDITTVEMMVRDKSLTSPRVLDQQGHSIFWDACAFHQMDVATLLLRAFGATGLSGIDIGEVHSTRGTTLLHLVAAARPFTQQAEFVFRSIFELSPEALQLHRDVKGRSFLHVAASSGNLIVLRIAIAADLEAAFDVPDAAGWSPWMLLEHHFSELKWTNELPLQKDHSACEMPSWCSLSLLQLADARSQDPPPAWDLKVEVDDEKEGLTTFQAHRVILAACSPELNRILRGLRPGKDTAVLQLDPDLCRRSDVALAALRFCYTGQLEASSFRSDPKALLQLLRLGRGYCLPSPLLRQSSELLFATLRSQESTDILSDVLVEAPQLQLTVEDRRFLARTLLKLCAVRSSRRHPQSPSNSSEAPAARRLRALEVALEEADEWLHQQASPACGAQDALVDTINYPAAAAGVGSQFALGSRQLQQQQQQQQQQLRLQQQQQQQHQQRPHVQWAPTIVEEDDPYEAPSGPAALHQQQQQQQQLHPHHQQQHHQQQQQHQQQYQQQRLQDFPMHVQPTSGLEETIEVSSAWAAPGNHQAGYGDGDDFLLHSWRGALRPSGGMEADVPVARGFW